MESYSSAFRKVGFFQFVRNYEHPVAELRSCLIATGGTEKLKQSVIVLPEAFNIGRDYDDQDHACDYGRSILSVLMDFVQNLPGHLHCGVGNRELRDRQATAEAAV